MNAAEEREQREWMISQGHADWCMALPRAGVTAPCNCPQGHYDWLGLFMSTEAAAHGDGCSCSKDCDRERAAAYAEIVRLRERLRTGILSRLAWWRT